MYDVVSAVVAYCTDEPVSVVVVYRSVESVGVVVVYCCYNEILTKELVENFNSAKLTWALSFENDI